MPADNVTINAEFEKAYLVSIDTAMTHGTVTLDKTTALENDTVNVTAVTPAAGYALKKLTYTPD